MDHHPDHDESSNAHSITFPFRLYQMLEEAEKRGFEDIVSWLPDGNGFIVHDREEFTSQVMKTFFCHTKWKSFLRQLNLYNFERLSKRGPGRGSCYSHPCLIRGEIDQCKQIHRSTTTAAGTTTTAIRTTTEHHPQGVDKSLLIRRMYFLEQATTIHDHSPLSSEMMDSKDHHDSNITLFHAIMETTVPFYRGDGVLGIGGNMTEMTLPTASHLDREPGCHNDGVSRFSGAMCITTTDDGQHDDDPTSTRTLSPDMQRLLLRQEQHDAHRQDDQRGSAQRKNEEGAAVTGNSRLVCRGTRTSSSSHPPLEAPTTRSINNNNKAAAGFATCEDNILLESSLISSATTTEETSLLLLSCSPNPIGSEKHIVTTTATNQALDLQSLLSECKSSFPEDMADAIVSIFCRRPS